MGIALDIALDTHNSLSVVFYDEGKLYADLTK